MSKSVEDYIESDERFFPKSFSWKQLPLIVSKAYGSIIEDAYGRKYIDFSTTLANIIGHSHPEVVDALKKQLEILTSFPTCYFYAEAPSKLAQKLVNITPGSYKKKIVFGFSGSDAVDMALTSSIFYTKKKFILSFQGSYHGTTYLSLSTSEIMAQNDTSKNLLYKNIVFVPYPNPYRNPWNINGYEKPDELTNTILREIEKTLKNLNNDFVGVVVEPIQGDGGIIVPPKDFLKELYKIVKSFNGIFIADEIQTGMGRTGRWWGVEHFSVEPDLMVIGKALGGCMPLSAVIGKSEVLEAPPALGFYLSGHPLSCISALKTIEIIERENLVNRAMVLGDYILRRLSKLSEKFNIIGDVRGKGLLIGMEIVKDDTSKAPDRKNALKICWAAWRRGVVAMTVGKHSNVIRITPALNVPMDLMERALEVIEESVKDVVNGKVTNDVLSFMKGWNPRLQD